MRNASWKIMAATLAVGLTPNVTPGADIVMDASLNTDGNNRWENIATDPADMEGLLDTANGVTRVAVSSTVDGITAAYDFPGGGENSHGAKFVRISDGSDVSFGNLEWNNSPVSLEIWFKPDPAASYTENGDILFETGGGIGLGVFYNDGMLQVGRNSQPRVINHDVSAVADEFIQVVVTYDSSTGTDNLVLYVNGQHAVTASGTSGNWCGGDAAALAQRGGANVGGLGGGQMNSQSFHGQMAIFRAYRNRILTPVEVEANYEAVANQLFSNLTATEVTTSSALLGAVLSSDVSAATLVWDTSDKGTDDTGDWSGNLGLGALVEGPVSGTATGLAADTFYVFRFFTAPDAWSAPAFFATELTAAQTPVFTTVEAATPVSIALAWEDNATTETGYVLKRALSTAGPFDVVAELPANTSSYVDSGLTPETTYFYQLAAVNNNNQSQTAFDDCQASATTPPLPLIRCQLGVLSMGTLGGLNPATGEAWKVGDLYRLVFITSANTTGASTDISTYNAFVQGVAEASTAFDLSGATWNVIGSTGAVAARDNTATHPTEDGPGEAIYLMDGETVIANDYADLWGGINNFLNLDENAELFNTDRVLTGSQVNGTQPTDGRVLGGSTEDPPRIMTGRSDRTGGGWMLNFNALTTQEYPVFAMSEPLTIESGAPAGTIIVIR